MSIRLKSAIQLAMGAGVLMLIFISIALAETLTEREKKARTYFSDTVLTDQDGNAYRFFSDLLRGRKVLINFVFTRCENACPLITRQLLQVRRQLGEQFAQDIWFLSLTTDPLYDTPARLHAFAEEQEANVNGWRFLTASPAVMYAIISKLGQWNDDPENHSTLVLAANPSAGRWTKIPPGAPPEYILAKLEGLGPVP